MRTSTKHRKEFEGMFTNFLGGLNKTMPPHAIEQNELIDATNWFYRPDTGYITTRPGLKKYTTVAAGGSVVGMFEYVKAGTAKTVLVTEESPQEAYYLDADPKPVAITGNLTGVKRPAFAVLNELLGIATGGALQTWDQAGSLVTPASAPSLDFIADFSKGVQNGAVARIVGCGNATYRDRAFMSGINDLSLWTPFDTTESNPKYMDAGYKDGMDLIGVAPFMGFVLLFKKGPSSSKRSIYKANLSDDSQYWACPRYKQMHSALSPHLIAEIGDGLLAVDVEGPKLITPSQQPTDNIPFAISPASNKIAGEMARYMDTSGFIIVDPVKMIAMVKPTKNSETFYCMDLVHGRWTMFKFAVNIQSGAYIGGKMLFGADDGFVYEYDDDLFQDNGSAYPMTIETKWFNFFDLRKELTKEKYLDVIGLKDGSLTMTVKRRGALLRTTDPLNFTEGWWDWDVVNALAPEDWTEDLEKTPLDTLFDDEVVDSDFVSFAVSVTQGRCSLSHLSGRVAEIGRGMDDN